jgi:hypothetical protein
LRSTAEAAAAQRAEGAHVQGATPIDSGSTRTTDLPPERK